MVQQPVDDAGELRPGVPSRIPLRDRVADAYASGTGARDWLRTTEDAIGAREAAVHAWVVHREAAAADAAARDDDRAEEVPLFGVPLAVKDIIDVAGLPTRCGSTIPDGAPAAESAACVRRLEALGAVVVGKTVTTEYAYFAPGPTENPAAPGHTPGGSSSGSAAAVAAGMVPLALGSQTAGSLTRPASYCGVAGMVLAHGAADLAGITGLSPSLDALGLLAGTVDDLEYAWRAFSGEQREARARGALCWWGSDLDALDPAMREVMARARGILGAEMLVEEFDWDDHVRTLAGDHPVIMSYEAVRERPEVVARSAEVSEPLARLLSEGAEISDADHEAALIRRDRSRVELDAVLPTGRVIVGPAAVGPAPRGLQATGSPILSRPWQALGLPVVTVPGARNAAGLPLGLQVIGRSGEEPEIYAVARILGDHLADFRTSN